MTISKAYPTKELSDYAKGTFVDLMAADLIDECVDVTSKDDVASALIRRRYGGPVIAELMDRAIDRVLEIRSSIREAAGNGEVARL